MSLASDLLNGKLTSKSTVVKESPITKVENLATLNESLKYPVKEVTYQNGIIFINCGDGCLISAKPINYGSVSSVSEAIGFKPNLSLPKMKVPDIIETPIETAVTPSINEDTKVLRGTMESLMFDVGDKEHD